MNLSADCFLGYYVHDEASYAAVLKPIGAMPYKVPALGICAASTGGGVEWEFVVTEHELNNTTIKVAMFAEAFLAFEQIPEFFAFLVDQAPATLEVVREFLDSIGAKDLTQRSGSKAGA
jgi:hypothetical protein